MTATKGQIYLAAVETLTPDVIRAKSPVLAAWLDECGEIVWCGVRADRSTMEGVWDEEDGLVMVQADLIVVTADTGSRGIRIELGGLQTGGIHRIEIHAPARTRMPFFAWPLTDEVRAVLDDPSAVAAAFDERASLMRRLSSVVEELQPEFALITSTMRLVDGVSSVIGGWDRFDSMLFDVDEKTVEHSIGCVRDDDGSFHWLVKATATVTFEGSDDRMAHTDLDVVVKIDDDDMLVRQIDLPPEPAPGGYAPVPPFAVVLGQ